MEKSDIEIIQSKIFVIHGIKVMLDKDLAELYGVERLDVTNCDIQ